MAEYTFADRYSEAGLQPGAEIISLRQTSADRLRKEANNSQILDLVQLYLGFFDIDLTWFRDQFAKEDASFSLVNNKREARILSAIILSKLVQDGNSTAILGLRVASFNGLRKPAEAGWLIPEAISKLNELAVSRRVPGVVTTLIKPVVTPKLAEEIAAVGNGDWAGLLTVLAKIRSEAVEGCKTVASQASAGMTPIYTQLKYSREENQMLWWLVGESSRTFEVPFNTFTPSQVAIISGLELAELTSTSHFGPFSATAILDKIIKLAKKEKSHIATIGSMIDQFSEEQLNLLPTNRADKPKRILPLMTAIELSFEHGDAWKPVFERVTGVLPTAAISPSDASSQLYYEHLLGQLS